MPDIYDVILSKQAEKDISRAPLPIVLKMQSWIRGIKKYGLRETRKIPGFHDEPLKGKRKGQRSIRLSKAYRGIYIIDNSGAIHFVKIIEVNKHDY